MTRGSDGEDEQCNYYNIIEAEEVVTGNKQLLQPQGKSKATVCER